MTLDLPGPIAAYFKADLADGKAVAQCFTDNAVVKDEGHTYNGRAAIKNWKADTGSIMGTLHDMERMMDLIVRSNIEPEIGTVLPMQRAEEAFRAMLNGETSGKTVLTR